MYTRFTAGPKRTLEECCGPMRSPRSGSRRPPARLFHRGLEVVVVSDGVSSFDAELAAASLRNLEMKFGRVEPASAVLEAVSGEVDITVVIER